jgi:hypothetical protein
MAENRRPRTRDRGAIKHTSTFSDQGGSLRLDAEAAQLMVTGGAAGKAENRSARGPL